MANKNSPGVVRMKCMIWEPQPITIRPQQDIAMIHSADTIENLPDSVKAGLEAIIGNDTSIPPSIYLKPKYSYKSTFLFDENGNHVSRPEYLSQFFKQGGLQPFDGAPGVVHQSFQQSGSLFRKANPVSDSGTATTTANSTSGSSSSASNATSAGTSSALGTPHWLYDKAPIDVETNSYDSLQFSEDDVVTPEAGSQNVPTPQLTYFAMYPNQVATSQLPFVSSVQGPPSPTASTSTSTSTADNAAVKPVHWRAKKITPLFQRQDIVVEFRRGAARADPVDPQALQGNPYIDDYIYLDPQAGVAGGQAAAANSVIVNRGVVNVDDSGNIDSSTLSEYDLRSQPYYMIELGSPADLDRYFIMIAGSSPRFIHVGRFPIETYDNGVLSIQDQGQITSRLLSAYKDVSSSALLELEKLRITIRNHMGKMVVVFGGYEDKPWIIERNDLASVDAPSDTTTTSQSPADYSYANVPLITSASNISIFGGNMLMGFIYFPLLYPEKQIFTIPQAIAIKGPVSSEEINLYLREEAVRIQPHQKPPDVDQIYFQDAEIYLETVNGSVTATPHILAQTPNEAFYGVALRGDRVSSGGGGTTGVPKTGNDEKMSYLRVQNRVPPKISSTTPPSSTTPGGASSGGTQPSQTQAIPVDPNQDDSVYVAWIYVQYELGAGDFQFPGLDSADFVTTTNTDSVPPFTTPPYMLRNCITPISTGWRLFVPASDISTSGSVKAVDVSQHVVGYSSQWQYTDAQRCDHNGSIRFWVFPDMPLGLDADNNPIPDRSAFLSALTDKTFFIRVYAWWERGYMACNCVGSCDGDCCGEPTPSKCALFTGMCHGGDISNQAGKRYMECQLLDYMKILSEQQFLNSPFFDGMRDYNAVDTILKLAGFRDNLGNTSDSDPWRPGSLISQIANTDRAGGYIMPFNGDTIYVQEYALPSSYDILQSPFMKFSDQSTMDEALMRIAGLSGKVIFFDRFGICHLDIRPDIGFQLRQTGPKAHFYASPRDLPDKCLGLNQLILNSYTWKRATADVINEIQIVSATPQGELIIGNDQNYPGKFDPTSPGFVGYTKRILQMDGIFGSQQAVQNVLNYYRGFFTPPILMSFEAFGNARLKAMDIVQLTGLDMDGGFPSNLTNDGLGSSTSPDGSRTCNLIITSLQHEIEPPTKWNSKFECEWIFTGSIQ